MLTQSMVDIAQISRLILKYCSLVTAMFGHVWGAKSYALALRLKQGKFLCTCKQWPPRRRWNCCELCCKTSRCYNLLFPSGMLAEVMSEQCYIQYI
jgi:hypothetical protein